MAPAKTVLAPMFARKTVIGFCAAPMLAAAGP